MIRFAHPQLFFLLIPLLGLLVWSIARQVRSYRKLRELGGSRVQWVVLGRVRFQRQRLKQLLFFAGLAFLIVAAVGPKVGMKVVELQRRGVDILLILDTSTSMDARDVRPSRLEKAQYELSRFLDGLSGDRVGMIVFAGTAHLHFPLTTDYGAARLFLGAVDTRLIRVQGTVLGEALELAIRSFDAESKKFKSVVILSDGEDHDGRALEVARRAAETGIVIHAVGLGSTSGAPIPVDDGQAFKKDAAGRVVTSVLNEAVLEELARAGQGTYTRVDNRSGGLEDLLAEIQAMEKRTLKSHEFSQFEDRYQLFALPALIFFLLELLLPGGRLEPPKVRSRYA